MLYPLSYEGETQDSTAPVTGRDVRVGPPDGRHG